MKKGDLTMDASTAFINMTKLEYASIEAMKGLLSNSDLSEGWTEDGINIIPPHAIKVAKELLKQLEGDNHAI